MSKLGFGLERLGLLALSKPALFSILIVLVTGFFGMNFSSVEFNGNVTGIVPKTSQTYLDYERQKETFRDFSRDVAIIVRSDRLTTKSGLDDLRSLQLDLSITDLISSAVTVFSIPRIDPETGKLGLYFPNTIEDDGQAQRLLTELQEDVPLASNLISGEDNAAVLLVSLDVGVDAGLDAEAFSTFESLIEEVESLVPDDFEVFYAGRTPVGLTIIQALVADQLKLTIFGLGLGALVAFVFFRNVVAALLCGLAASLTAIWAIGFFGVMNVPITYLTTILPTLALILAYADSIVLFHYWNRLNQEADSDFDARVENLKRAVLRVGPASALTSFTTAVALSSFAFSSSEALREFAWLGVVLVSFAFLSVIIVLPVASYLCLKVGALRFRERKEMGKGVWRGVVGIFQGAPVLICVLSVAATVGLFLVQSQLQANYRLTDYLPSDAKTRDAERIANDVFGGRSQVFFTVPAVEEGGLSSVANRERLSEVHELLEEFYGERRVYSLHSLWSGLDAGATEGVAEQFESIPPEIRSGYISEDGRNMLISLRVSSSQSSTEGLEFLAKLRERLSVLDYANELTIAGFPVLLAEDFTSVINELRSSLLIAVFLGICLIGLATRSVFYACVAAIPNLLPILLLQALIYMNNGTIDVTEVVALTIAFGIAIDNAVHILNVFEAERRAGKDVSEALRISVMEVGPAISGSALIICCATLVTLTSSLPLLPIIGKLVIAILIVALFTNLFILPANILAFKRFAGGKPKS